MMMWVNRIKSGSNLADAEAWAALFAKGQLEPQSHSYSHADLRSSTEKGQANQTAEILEREIVTSKTMLEQIFPEYDCISFASAFGGLSLEASALAREHYYSIRGVSRKNIQSTNPSTSGGSGSWANLYSPSVVVDGATEEEQIAFLKENIDAHVAAGGWYTPFIHSVGDSSSAEMSAAVTDAYFAYLDTYQESGELWVTKHSSAVKYIRERQNSTPKAYAKDGKIYVSSTMAAETEDGLPLPLDVFNHPLTVRVTLPEDCASVSYTLNAEERTALARKNSAGCYAYIDVLPDGTETVVSTVAGEPVMDEEDPLLIRTEQGDFVIPEEYEDTEAYPWVAFREDGTFIAASDIFCAGNDKANSILEQNDYKTQSETHYIFLRRSFTHSIGAAFGDLAELAGALVIDLRGHTLTLSAIPETGLFLGEGKSENHVQLTFVGGTLVNRTRAPILNACPADQAGAYFDITFINMTLSAGENLKSVSDPFYLVASVTENTKQPQSYSITFVDSTLDLTNLPGKARAFLTGSQEDNVDANIEFLGGTIKGNLARLVRMRGFSNTDVTFSKNEAGQYTTNTLPKDSAAPTRIVSSEEGLLSFKTAAPDPKDSAYVIYTPTIEASTLATKYGWLPDDNSSMVLFDPNTQSVLYSGEKLMDYYDGEDHPAVLYAIDAAEENYVVYLRKDVGTSAFTGTVFNLSRKSSTLTFEMNGHTLTLTQTLFRVQVKKDNLIQKFRINGGTVNLNGKPLAATGTNSAPQNARICFVFDQVNFTGIKDSSAIIADNLDKRTNTHSFQFDFNDCTFDVASEYTGKLFSFTKNSCTHNVRINGGTVKTEKTALPTLFYTTEGNSSSITLAPGADGKLPVIMTAKSTAALDETPFSTPYGELQYANSATEGSVSTWKLTQLTPYGNIDEEHLDVEKYPLVLFLNGKVLYPESYGGYEGDTVVQLYFRSSSQRNKDAVLWVRRDYTLSGTNEFTGAIGGNFVIDLCGNTVTTTTPLLHMQSRTSNTATITVKNGTLISTNHFIVYGTTSADGKHSEILFENVTIDNIQKSLITSAFVDTPNDKYPNRDTYKMSMNMVFNNCTFNVSSQMSKSIFQFGKEERGEIHITFNGGTFNFDNQKYSVFISGWDGRTVKFGTYNGEYARVNIASDVSLWQKTEMGTDGMPMQYRKISEDNATATYTLSSLSIVSAYLNITNDLNLVYRVLIPAGFDMPKAVFVVDGHTIEVSDYSKDENGLYLFKLSALGPHRMADTVTATVSASYNGQTVADTNSTLSVKSYADAVRAENAGDVELIALLDALLVYGAGAQVYMNHNTDNLVAELKDLSEIPEGSIEHTGSANADYVIAGVALRLNGAFDLGVRIKAEDITSLSLKITKGGSERLITITEDMRTDDGFVLYYNGLIASELDERITLTLLRDGVEIGESLTLTANAYLAKLAEGESAALTNLAKALYAYGVAADIYRESFLDSNYTPKAEIVNKGGAEGAVSYVIDDENEITATYANALLEKYANLSLTYAMRTKAIATLLTEEDPDGLLHYRQNNDGSYIYTLNEASVAFWREITKSDRVEIVSHTHTHAFWGTNDDGGEFKYLKNSGDTVYTSTQPVGSSSKEIYAAMQILKDVFGDLDPRNTLSFVAAGIGVATKDQEVDGEMIVSYIHYFDSLLSDAVAQDKIVTVRSTFGATNTESSASKVVTKDTLKTDENRLKVPAYMILDSNAGENIENWTAYIDHALEKNGWAPFCIHQIREKEFNSHHILLSQAEQLFAYTASLGDRVWVATYTEASLYFCEWSSASVSCEYTDGAVTVTLTDEENNEIFDMPLTVKVAVPNSFRGGAVANGQELEVRANEDGTRYVLVDIVPDSGALTIYAK